MCSVCCGARNQKPHQRLITARTTMGDLFLAKWESAVYLFLRRAAAYGRTRSIDHRFPDPSSPSSSLRTSFAGWNSFGWGEKNENKKNMTSAILSLCSRKVGSHLRLLIWRGEGMSSGTLAGVWSGSAPESWQKTKHHLHSSKWCVWLIPRTLQIIDIYRGLMTNPGQMEPRIRWWEEVGVSFYLFIYLFSVVWGEPRHTNHKQDVLLNRSINNNNKNTVWRTSGFCVKPSFIFSPHFNRSSNYLLIHKHRPRASVQIRNQRFRHFRKKKKKLAWSCSSPVRVQCPR